MQIRRARRYIDRVVAGALRELLPTYWLWLARIGCSLIIANYVYHVYHRVCDVSVRMHECAVSRALLMSYAWFNAFYALSVRRSVGQCCFGARRRAAPKPHTPLMLTFVYRPAQNIHSLHNVLALCIHITLSECVRLRPHLVPLATAHSLLVLNYGETHSHSKMTPHYIH